MTVVLMVIGGIYLFVVTWVLYLAVMNLRRNRDKLTPAAKVIAYPVAFIGVLVDAVFNIILGTLFFLELPKEWLFTHRLERHIKESLGYRKRFARWFCVNLLDPFDPDGVHCD